MNPMAAIKAYQSVQSGAAVGGPGGMDPAGGSEFGAILDGVMKGAVEQTRAAETQMSMAVQGQGSLIDVVTAVSSAEASLETVMAVRDQVIQAYQEIMRMPI
ncbi:MAG: flagellar hook-basal body complex protein FliE [Caulobacteraceae bacterium]|nr:flagellar hook-basal body complex protein FliE [Caulobacteraceae bacterium]